jgi:hypothetical protein
MQDVAATMPVRWELTNTAWVNATRKAGLTNVRFHDLAHVGFMASAVRNELRRAKGTRGWKSRSMVDRYAKFATENLEVAAARIERERDRTWGLTSRFPHVHESAEASNDAHAFDS